MKLPLVVDWRVELGLAMTVIEVVDRRPDCQTINVVFKEDFPDDKWDSGLGLNAKQIIDAVTQKAVGLVASMLGVDPTQLKGIRPVIGYSNTIVVEAAQGTELPTRIQPLLLDDTQG